MTLSKLWVSCDSTDGLSSYSMFNFRLTVRAHVTFILALIESHFPHEVLGSSS